MEIHKLKVKTTTKPFKLSIGVAPVIFENRKILLVKSAKRNIWKFPGSAINDDESLLQGGARECFEETTLKVTLYGEPFLYHHVEDHNYQILIFHYKAKILEGVATGSTEIVKVEYFDTNNLPENIFPNVTVAVRHYQ